MTATGLVEVPARSCACGGGCECGGRCGCETGRGACQPRQAVSALPSASCCCGTGQAVALAQQAILQSRETSARDEGNERENGPSTTSVDADDEWSQGVVRELDAETSVADVSLKNLHCASCVASVERLPTSLPGLLEARVNLREATARLVWRHGQLNFGTIATALEQRGFPAQPMRSSNSRDERRRENREQLVRLAVSGAIATNVMLLALALYAGAEGGGFAAYELLFRWLSAGLTVLSLAWPGRVFFSSSWRAIRAGRLNLDAPIALAMAVGGVAGLVNTIRGAGEIYFDSVAALVFLLLIGRWLQGRQQRWAIDEVEMLLTLTPGKARKVENTPSGEVVREVAIDRLTPGDLVEVRAGETMPVDGHVVSGRSHVDESLLSGESRPIAIDAGSTVTAGSVNLESVVRIRVSVAGRETRIGKLMATLAEAADRKAPTIRWADRLSGYFISGMLALSLITLIVWWRIEPARAIENAASLLIVTCPCALGLAMPLVMTLAIGRAARRQILIKGGDALEALVSPSTLLLDKTGTLTQSRVRVVSWCGEPKWQPIAAAIERHASHPIALAIADAYGSQPSTVSILNVAHTVGGGLDATIQEGQATRRVSIGSRVYVESKGAAISARLRDELDRIALAGHTPVVLAVDGVAEACIGLGDPPRDDAKWAVSALTARGWNLGVLSGDDARVVRSVATQLGLPLSSSRGGVSPEGKVAAVEEAMKRGPVVMVGDGVNDAAALATATVGIAVHGGSEASLTAADIYLARPGLTPIVELVEAAARTRKVLHRCLMASVTYNVISGTLAVCGMISPLIAAILMPASSVTVLAIAVLSRTFERDVAKDHAQGGR